MGKSTLLNALVGQKVSITSAKPETTRQQILGIRTYPDVQLIYVDTPGIPPPLKRSRLHQMMQRSALSSLSSVDIIVWVLDRTKWQSEEERWLAILQKSPVAVIAAINKVDKLSNKTLLLSHLAELSKRMSFLALVPISAKKGTQIPELERVLQQHLPVAPPLFDKDTISDKESSFFITEWIRESVIRALGSELPYSAAVQLDIFQEKPNIVHLAATIWVEKMGQKKIVIGQGGKRLRFIGKKARLDCERLLGKKVFLQLWVKIKSGWREDDKLLKELGL
ncbi:MAG: GTPase Era [Gammaproteobacteria bacterium]|nr:GTPase Era [Gammaproteobacteria bacterium]